jgi:hypothetical protein
LLAMPCLHPYLPGAIPPRTTGTTIRTRLSAASTPVARGEGDGPCRPPPAHRMPIPSAAVSSRAIASAASNSS